MKSLLCPLLLALCCVTGPGQATDVASVGPTSSPGSIECYPDDDCYYELHQHHDDTFENGYAWSYAGIDPPYYGAFGEAYEPSWLNDEFGGGARPQNTYPDGVECVVLWLTDIGYYAGHTCDLYVWDGGLTSEPGEVLCVVPGVDPGPPAFWPNISEHRFYTACYGVQAAITVGYWGYWPGGLQGWYVGADLDGGGGHPWTCVAPGIGYQTGWIDPSIIWGPTQSLGIGYTGGFWYTPAQSATWGGIKALFEVSP